MLPFECKETSFSVERCSTCTKQRVSIFSGFFSFFLQMPNLVGIALGVLQLGLFVVYPKSKMPSLETTAEIL